jgi:pyridoxamine 5'-phosphate oxidase family protein
VNNYLQTTLPDGSSEIQYVERKSFLQSTSEVYQARRAVLHTSDPATGKFFAISVAGGSVILKNRYTVTSIVPGRWAVPKPRTYVSEGQVVLFTHDELEYLRSQFLARLATVQPDETVQVNPVCYRYNEELTAIEIGGFNFSRSRKFRNIAANGRAAVVVDDVVSTDPWRIRCLEIRGEGRIATDPGAFPDLDDEIIRVHPKRIISFGLTEPDKAPHELVGHNRDVA